MYSRERAPLSDDPAAHGATDMAVALTSTGQAVVAMPEIAPNGDGYNPLRVRMFTP